MTDCFEDIVRLPCRLDEKSGQLLIPPEAAGWAVSEHAPLNLKVLLACGRLALSPQLDSHRQPLLSDLIKRNQPLMDAPAPPDYPRRIPPENYVTMGRWLVGQLSPDNDTGPLTARNLQTAYEWGIFPHPNRVRRSASFGSLTAFNRALGRWPKRRRGAYDSWDRQQFGDYVESVWNRKPDSRGLTWALESAAARDNGPSRRVIVEHAGLPTDLLRERGYYMAGLSMDAQLEWGVLVMLANDGASLTRQRITAISNAKRGPSDFLLRQTWDTTTRFKTLVARAYEERLSASQAASQQYDVPPEITYGQRPARRLTQVARYRVARRCLALAGDNAARCHLPHVVQPAWFEGFVARLRQHDPRLTTASVINIARQLQVEADLLDPERALRLYRVVDD